MATLPELPSTCAALLALLVPGCDRPPAPEPAGPLAVDEATLDLGRVFEGRILEHEWEVLVRASTAVSAAKTDCGCTLARLERAGSAGRVPYELGAPLAAGERLYVRLRYDTRGRRGPAPRAVTLTLPGPGALALTLAADVQPWLTVEPQELAFQRVLEGEGAECSFEVRSVAGTPFRLEATRLGLPEWVELALAPEGVDARGRAPLWRVQARLAPSAPRGTFHYPLELASDEPIPGTEADGAGRSFTVAPGWRLQVVGPVALSSPRLEFGLVRPDETIARSVRLESYDPGFVPEAATARLEPLHSGEPLPLSRTATVRTRHDGRGCDIELVLAGLDGEVAGTFLAKLVVETGHPALPRLEALVRGVRAPEGAR